MAVAPLPSLLRQCLVRRVSPDDLVRLLQQKQEQEQKQQQQNGKALFRSFLDARQSLCLPSDPLPPRYLEALVVAQLVPFSDALLVFIARWNAAVPKRVSATDLNSLHEITLLLVSPRLSPLSAQLTGQCLLLASRWLTAVARCINSSNSNSNSSTNANANTTITNNAAVDPSVSQLAEACASFLVTLSATGPGIALLSEKTSSSNDKEKASHNVMEAVGLAVDLAIALFPVISTQLMERLGVVHKHIAMLTAAAAPPDAHALAADDPHHPDLLQALQFQETIPEPEMVGSRPATLLYLEGMLFTASTLDDTALFNFLEGRYCQNYHAMFVDLLFASLHLLNKSFHLGQPYFDHTQLFMRNKLPSVLSSIVSNPFATFTSEQAMSEVWLDLTADLRSSTDLQPCLHRFLHVCFLMELISEAKRNELIGDNSAITALSTKSLQSKDDVVAQVNSGHTRPAQLVHQLPHADGSAAALAQAIVQIILTYCQNKETHHLKDLSHAIIRNAEAVNALALFIRPAYWLSPLCSLLDQWRWDEIQGESQPLYDEFGAILLLPLVAKRRLSLVKSELGISNFTGFVSRYLDHEGTYINLRDLSPDSQKHLGEWVNALYVAESLNDELTASCSPQDFYLFIPTLLAQSLLAVQCGKLGQDSLKGGLEFLLEPFLLPSLVSALSWISSWPDPTAASSILPVLSKSPENADAKSIHQTIITMTSSVAHFAFQRAWLSPPSASSAPSAPPASSSTVVTFAKDMSSAVSNLATDANLSADFDRLIQDCGLDLALRTLLNILIRYSGTADFLIALDLCSTLVCLVHRQTRDLLKLKAATIAGLLRQNQTLLAEAIVHLHRRVEAYASVLLVPDLGIDQFATLQLTNMEQVGGGGAATTDAAAAASMDVQPASSTHPDGQADAVDQPMDDIDQVLNDTAAMSSVDQVDPSGLNIDDFYGLQNEMGNLDDLDLDMFS